MEFRAESVEILVFPGPAGYLLTSFDFPLFSWLVI